MDLELDGCSPLSDSDSVVDWIVSFRVENFRQVYPHPVLKMVAEDIDPGMLLQGDVEPVGGVTDVAFVREAKSGETFNVAFTEPLQTGHYVWLCYPQDSGGINGAQPAAEEIVATFTLK